ncbi:pyocin activator PrtN family protein [Endozoicomonas sp. ALC020]|uniref:pyocin activator PrtN family protein n=1 Tax=unclassified Endozoicomonas TaxID=2644528 RepID=UPI003BB1960F
MKTEFALLAQYEKSFVPLEIVCQDFFNIGPQKAKQLAARGELPIPVMRGSHSQKSPYLVKVSDLASYLDEQYANYRDDWEKVRS